MADNDREALVEMAGPSVDPITGRYRDDKGRSRAWPHDEYQHQRRQTAALERIVELLEGLTREMTAATGPSCEFHGFPNCQSCGGDHD